MKVDDIEVGMRVQKTNISWTKPRNFFHGTIIGLPYEYRPGGWKVTVQWDTGSVRDVSVQVVRRIK